MDVPLFYGVDASVVNPTGSSRCGPLSYEVAHEDQIKPAARARVFRRPRCGRLRDGSSRGRSTRPIKVGNAYYVGEGAIYQEGNRPLRLPQRLTLQEIEERSESKRTK